MKMDDVAIYNAIATAEGAIMEAIKMQPINLHKSRCLVLGYGRCAKVLAAKLKGMDAQVTVPEIKQQEVLQNLLDLRLWILRN